jgi:hypothetical protein
VDLASLLPVALSEPVSPLPPAIPWRQSTSETRMAAILPADHYAHRDFPMTCGERAARPSGLIGPAARPTRSLRRAIQFLFAEQAGLHLAGPVDGSLVSELSGDINPRFSAWTRSRFLL